MKRPPRQVWLVVEAEEIVSAHLTKKDAADWSARANRSHGTDYQQVAGPYVLAERVRQK
jgi:hypothetical protein